MGRFLVSRLLQAAIALLLLTLLIFVMSRFVGNPLDIMLPADAPPETRERLVKVLGLDRPLYVQYATYMGQLLQGDLGKSVRSRAPVANLIQARLPASFSLALVAMGFTVVIAVPLGVLAAIKRGTPLDSLARLIALLGQALPAFWVGILLVELFAVRLELLPASGRAGPASYILPAFAMSLFVIAGVTRLVRNGMLEVLDSEFVRFVRSTGVPEHTVIWKHALRNALIPVLGFGGVYFAIFITMAIVVEVVFAWPGLGRLAFNAIVLRDYPIMQGVILVSGAIVIAVNFVVDLLYAVADPRIRHTGS